MDIIDYYLIRNIDVLNIYIKYNYGKYKANYIKCYYSFTDRLLDDYNNKVEDILNQLCFQMIHELNAKTKHNYCYGCNSYVSDFIIMLKDKIKIFKRLLTINIYQEVLNKKQECAIYARLL